MKTRKGFVSNSSASSFIVWHLDVIYVPGKDGILRKRGIKKRLSKRQIDSLKKHGFRATWVGCPSRLMKIQYDDDTWKPARSSDTGAVIYMNYGHCVHCNEHDEIQFLIEKQHSFIASCHYGHETYLYHAGDNYVMYFQNYGCQVETYHYNKSYKDIVKCFGSNPQPYRKMQLKEILVAKDAKKVIDQIRKKKAADKAKKEIS